MGDSNGVSRFCPTLSLLFLYTALPLLNVVNLFIARQGCVSLSLMLNERCLINLYRIRTEHCWLDFDHFIVFQGYRVMPLFQCLSDNHLPKSVTFHNNPFGFYFILNLMCKRINIDIMYLLGRGSMTCLFHE